jgi:hypothetical protein
VALSNYFKRCKFNEVLDKERMSLTVWLLISHNFAQTLCNKKNMKYVFTLAFFILSVFYTWAQQPAHPKLSPGKKVMPSIKNTDVATNLSAGPSSAGISLKGDQPADFNGQWKGGFNESSYGFTGMVGNSIDYVLEIQTSGSEVTGYSYTYFSDGPKRFYTICKLTGTVNTASREITVTETERVKFNTPPGFQNCFQTHKLHYVQDSSNVETLRGSWIPAPNQTGDCGYGTTLLSRRIINRTPVFIKPAERTTAKADVPKSKLAAKPKTLTPKSYAKPLTSRPHIANNPIVKKLPSTRDLPSEIPESHQSVPVISPLAKFEPRRKDILKTISITQATFKVDFYDNGEIDGDSITVFYNGKILLSHKMLTTNALSLTLALDENVKENIITMYADNLGTIPPNTALMIVTDGDKRYEVRITSDTEKSGSVVFVHDQK